MTTRVQEKVCLQKEGTLREPRMRPLEKAMLRHAVFDPADKVLDANVCSGQVAEYLLRNMDCQVCGVSDRMEEIRRTRARMYGGDFVYAAVGDIPWQENTFDTVLLHPAEGGQEALRAQLKESSRVLKPGGQLVLGLKSVPASLQRIGQLFWENLSDEEPLPGVPAAQEAMEACRFEHISHIRAGLNGHVLIGWKSKAEA